MLQYNDDDMVVTSDGKEFHDMHDALNHEFKDDVNEVKELFSKLAIKFKKNKNIMQSIDEMDYPAGPPLLFQFIIQMAEEDCEPTNWDYYNSYGS